MTSDSAQFLREAIKLAQLRGLRYHQALELVNSSYNRDVDETSDQMVENVTAALARLCVAYRRVT